MNFLDKSISFFAPQAALRRMRARVAMELFSYDGAKSGRRTDGWLAAGTDANAEIGTALVSLRTRSRDLIRNNPYASKAVEELVGNTVGTGIVPHAKTGSVALDKIIDTEWQFFSERCDPGGQYDFYGMQALVARTTAESGEAIARFRPRLPQDGLRVPLQIQTLEADFLDSSRTMGSSDGGWIIQGVEFDPIGRRKFYWLFGQHPGAVVLMNPRGGILSRQVPADEVLHNYRVLRPGQVRGVPFLAPSMLALRDLDDYRDAERIRKKIEACMMGFVTQPDGASGAPIGVKSTDPQTGQTIERFEPGMIPYLKPGQEIKFNEPKPVGGYREYLMTELQGILAGVCVPYELGTNDMSNVNFSSWRGGMLGFRNIIEAHRWLTLIPMFCNPVWKRFIDTLVLVGKIKQPAYGVQWTAPKFESVDPIKDAEADKAEMRCGTLTWPQAVTQKGNDPETQIKEIEDWNKRFDAAGIILDSDPRNTTSKGQEQPADSAEQAVKTTRAPAPKPNGKVNGAATMEGFDLSGIEQETRNRTQRTYPNH